MKGSASFRNMARREMENSRRSFFPHFTLFVVVQDFDHTKQVSAAIRFTEFRLIYRETARTRKLIST
jgi:2'-5' RNA ligase